MQNLIYGPMCYITEICWIKKQICQLIVNIIWKLERRKEEPACRQEMNKV